MSVMKSRPMLTKDKAMFGWNAEGKPVILRDPATKAEALKYSDADVERARQAHEVLVGFVATVNPDYVGVAEGVAIHDDADRKARKCDAKRNHAWAKTQAENRAKKAQEKVVAEGTFNDLPEALYTEALSRVYKDAYNRALESAARSVLTGETMLVKDTVLDTLAVAQAAVKDKVIARRAARKAAMEAGQPLSDDFRAEGDELVEVKAAIEAVAKVA